MLEVKNLSIQIDQKTILKELSFTLHKKEKMAIIGEEGNGKSTLLKVLLGDCPYAEITGTIQHKGNILGYLKQSLTREEEGMNPLDYLLGNTDISQKQSVFYKYKKHLHIDDKILENSKIKNLSGGEKIKLGLLKILIEEPDILLLDEPTNDLDIETLEWLETFIIEEERPILYVSHDETLLSRTANAIMHIELVKKKRESKHTISRTSYDSYIKNRISFIDKETQVARKEKEQYHKKEQKLREVMQKVEHRQNTITPKDPHGGKMLKRKMSSLKSQEARLHNQLLTEEPSYESAICLFFENIEIPANKKIVDCKEQVISIENRVIVEKVNLSVIGPKHVVIIGKNGTGKSTLLKQIYKNLNKREDITVGYMPQNYDETLKNFKKPMDYLEETGDKAMQARIGTLLGNLHFTREEMVQNIEELSGGSKAKLLLLKLTLSKCNVLLLDEPTRNLSPLSSSVIRASLKSFQGTIISVSHDRKCIEEVCDTVYVLSETGLSLQRKE